MTCQPAVSAGRRASCCAGRPACSVLTMARRGRGRRPQPGPPCAAAFTVRHTVPPLQLTTLSFGLPKPTAIRPVPPQITTHLPVPPQPTAPSRELPHPHGKVGCGQRWHRTAGCGGTGRWVVGSRPWHAHLPPSRGAAARSKTFRGVAVHRGRENRVFVRAIHPAHL